MADDFPSHPIKLVVPFGAGSVADIVGRKVGDKAGQLLKTTFVVENRPGAGGAIGAEAVATAAPDGYTICLGTVASHAIAAAMEKLPYDPIKDFKPIALLVTTASLIVVNSAVPAKTLPEYLDYARRKGCLALCFWGRRDNYPAASRTHQGQTESPVAACAGRQGRRFIQ